MANKTIKRGKWRIKPRVFLMLTLLLLAVFICIFAAFNIFITNYIRHNVESQLSGLLDQPRMFDDWQPGGKEDFLPDLSRQPRSKIGAHGEVFTVNSAYQVLEYSEFNTTEVSEIAAYLQSRSAPLEKLHNQTIKTESGEYCISSTADTRQTDTYLVYYVNVTGIASLVNTVNISLAIIMAAALLISFLIANVIAGSVTRPVSKLSAFAAKMGRSDFAREEFAFADVEFDELGEAMNQAAEKLGKYDNEQRTFFQNASHELRSPLMSIRCYAEGVECGLMEPQKASATIITETDRLSELVEDLLYISRVDNITSQVEMKENDLRDTLALAAASLQSQVEKNGLCFEYLFDNQPVLFSYNEKHLYRAFVNLIANAIRYAASTVTLRCHQAEGRIDLAVIDDGPGISAEDLPHVFERFYKGRDGKHGIGLSIAKSVVELHSGQLDVNCEGQTTFSISFSTK